MTVLDVDGPGLGIEIKLVTRKSKKERRAILRGFFQQIRPWLESLEPEGRTSARIDHVASGVIRSARAQAGIQAFQGGTLSEPAVAIGSEIRTRRLALGLTQSELARRIGIQRSHLSDLERGLYRAKSETMNAIERALQE